MKKPTSSLRLYDFRLLNSPFYAARRLWRRSALLGSLFLLLAMSAGLSVQAQSSTAYFNQATRLFNGKKFFEAAQCYEKYLAFGNTVRPHAMPFAVQKSGKSTIDPRHEATYKLAECYRFTNDFVQAEKWYKKSMEQHGQPYPLARLWYAMSLRANEKYDTAITVLGDFQMNYGKLDAYSYLASRELDNLRFIQDQLTPGKRAAFFVNRQQVNDSISGFGLRPIGADSLLFTSTEVSTITTGKARKPKTTEQFHNQLFLSTGSDTSLAQISKFSFPPAEAGINQGQLSLSKDKMTAYFTRWSSDPAAPQAMIYKSRWSDTGWSKPKALGNSINQPGSNNKQPFITDDGHFIVFASDRKGGSGGYDLWVASIDSAGAVGKARNLGGAINTIGDEVSPYYHSVAGTLVFASNGLVGMGGFDIYGAKGSLLLNDWTRPVNPGSELNSSKDDMYYVSRDPENLWNEGWISSDRSSECCLALYSTRQNNRQHISGQVVDCGNQAPLANTSVTVSDKRHPGNNKTVTTDENGRYVFEASNLSYYELLTTREKYEPKTGSYQVRIDTGDDSVENAIICLVMKRDSVTSLDQLHEELRRLSKSSELSRFAFGKSDLKRGAYGNFDSLVHIMNKYPTARIQVLGFTDGKGSEEFNLRLAQARVDICIAYLVKQGIGRDRLVGKAMGECCPIEPETINGKDNPKGRARNRRVEYKLLEEDGLLEIKQ